MPERTFAAARADRLDKIVAGQVADLSRSAAQRLIDDGRVLVNGVARPASHRVKAGDSIVVHVPEAAPSAVLPEAIALDILYEDADVLAVNKAAGMVVHPGAGNPAGTLANAALGYAPVIAGVGDEKRPGIVHRLDKETSGIVLIAKTEPAYRALQAQFKSRTVKKLYLAVCVGELRPARGIIDRPIGRDPAHRQRMAVVLDGRRAVTRYAVAEVFSGAGQRGPVHGAGGQVEVEVEVGAGARYSFVRARPETGRTHQLRVHFAALGCPIVGDRLYGATRRDPLSRALAPRHLLHASELSFELPSSGRTMALYAPIPADMRSVIDLLAQGAGTF